MIPIVILCGGFGTRLKEMTEFLPKPLVPIGPYPMVVHIMKLYARYGFTNFILALGYKQEKFKEYFSHYDLINNDITVDIGRGISRLGRAEVGWRVTLADTGENTLKSERLKRVEKYVNGDTFLVTYGDGLGDIDIRAVLEFHQSHGKIATITGIHPRPRFGEITHNDGLVCDFAEKKDNECLVNGGFMVFNRRVFDYLGMDDLEDGTMEYLAAEKQLMVYHHQGYWQNMDTLKDMDELQQEWETGRARWVK